MLHGIALEIVRIKFPTSSFFDVVGKTLFFVHVIFRWLLQYLSQFYRCPNVYALIYNLIVAFAKQNTIQYPLLFKQNDIL